MGVIKTNREIKRHGKNNSNVHGFEYEQKQKNAQQLTDEKGD